MAQSLRPYPQFGGIGIILSPLGNTWYDSLQVKATQRLARGLDFILAYTWSKNLATVTEQGGGSVPLNNIFDRRSIKTLSPNDQPHIFVASFRYESPVLAWMRGDAWKRAAFEGWNLSGIFRYASGEPILIPTAQNSLGNLIFRSTYANRVAGEPLFTKDLNCGCIDPNRDFVLNPKAWADAPPGTFGVTSVYQSDYRTSRNTSEDMSFGKLTRFGERTSLEIRVEFFNIFNRVRLFNPDSGNALATRLVNAAGVPQSGFGRINGGGAQSLPRTGQLAMRIRF